MRTPEERLAAVRVVWTDIPEDQRATEADCLRYYAPAAAEPLIQRIRNAGKPGTCTGAIYKPQLKKWTPCAGDTYGDERCRRHGGPGAPRPPEREPDPSHYVYQLQDRAAKAEEEVRRLREEIRHLKDESRSHSEEFYAAGRRAVQAFRGD